MEFEQENPDQVALVDATYWMYLNDIKIDGRPFELEGRQYQQEIMRPYTGEGKDKRFKHNEVIRKGSQIGVTIGKVVEATHGALNYLYPQGIIFYFPSLKAVELFSKTRFKTFIDDNPESVGQYMGKTDSVYVRKVGPTFVNFFGAGATSMVGGEKKDSVAVRMTPADWILLDERDLFDEDMAKQVNQRLGNSKIRRRTDMGTPSIPEYGIDLLYRKSNMCRWQIQCEACKKHTCIETEFPSCIRLHDDESYFICSHCKARIDRNNGVWIPDFPKRDVVGYWSSQLLNPNCDPALILRQFADPEAYDMDEGEFQRTVIGLPHTSVDDELSESDIYACCGNDIMEYESEIPCAMGVDVGKLLHAVIGYRKDRGRYKIIKVAEALNWGELHNLARRFNVKADVIDIKPEYHKVREFQSEASHTVYLCDYSDHLKVFDSWSGSPDNIVKVNRTEIFDMSHAAVRDPGVLELPRVNEIMKVFAHQMTRSVRVQETDKRTGVKVYRWKRRGDKEDHFRSAFNYFLLACKKVGVQSGSVKGGVDSKRVVKQDMTYKIGV
jgi:hypothetical protein